MAFAFCTSLTRFDPIRLAMHVAHNIPVLMYHHVTQDGGKLSVSASNFDSQMRHLARNGYTALSAQDLAEFYNGRALPRKSVLITFDDGYLDNWVYAHPVLQRYGLRAVLFLVTGLIGQGPTRAHAGLTAEVPFCPPHQQAKALMFSQDADQVMLRWDEVQAMVAAGTFDIHCHTHTHTRWDLQCTSAEEKTRRIFDDLQQSKETMLRQLGQASSHLCWPQGYTDADYKRVAAELGFRFYYTTDARGQNRAHGDAGHIYRFAVRNRPSPWLRQRLWLATHPTWGPLYNRWKSR